MGNKRRTMLPLGSVLVAAFTAIWLVAACSGGTHPGNVNDHHDAGAIADAAPDVPVPRCGNGVLDPWEECDGEELGGLLCVDVTGREDGELRCTGDCFWDVSGCHGCGNGILEETEECDGPSLGGETCATVTGLAQGELRCSADCTFDASGCRECGNGIAEGDEECDGEDHAGASCRDHGFTAEAGLFCLPDCTLDSLGCAGTCGDGVREPDEACDGTDLGILSCQFYGYLLPGTLLCSADCRGGNPVLCEAVCGNGLVEPGEGCDDGNGQDDDECLDGEVGTCAYAVCGDGIARTQGSWTEECDGDDLGGQSCESLFGTSGVLSCGQFCQFETLGCTCGNGVLDGDEECDGLDLGGVTCLDFGYEGGAPGCDGQCLLDLSGCFGLLWYFREDFEGVTHQMEFWSGMSEWEVGAPYAPGEPPGAHEGVQCAGTIIGGNYSCEQQTDQSMETPEIDLTSAIHPVLVFYQWLDSEEGYDGAHLSIWLQPGGDFFATDENIEPRYNSVAPIFGEGMYSGDLSALGWHRVVVDMAEAAGQTARISFRFTCDTSVSAAGWYVDDILVTEAANLAVMHWTDPHLGTFGVGQSLAVGLRQLGGSGSNTWTVEGGVSHSWLSLDPDSGLLSGTPGAADLGPGEITIRVTDDASPAQFDERTFTFEVVQAVATPVQFDFEGGPPSDWDFGLEWQWGTPANVGPTACAGGTGCVGTMIADPYSPECRHRHCSLTSPIISLVGLTAPVLEFDHFVETDEWGSSGTLQLSTNGGVQWTAVDAAAVFPGYHVVSAYCQGTQPGHEFDAWAGERSNEGWQRILVDLSAWAGQAVQLRWAFCSEYNSSAVGGWYVDNVGITSAELLPVAHRTNAALGVHLVNLGFATPLLAFGGSGSYQWTIEGGTNHGWLSLEASTGLLQGTPTASDAGPVSITIRVTDTASPFTQDERTFTFEVVSVASAPVSWDFDSGLPEGWSLSAAWEWGSPSVVGPGACAGGSGSCVGTNLSGNHADECVAEACGLDTPPIDLSTLTNPYLVFAQYLETDSSDGGSLYISTDGGNSWAPIGAGAVTPPFTDQIWACEPSSNLQWVWAGDRSSSGWQTVQVDLSAYAGQVIRVRFGLCSDEWMSFAGWYVDDVAFLDSSSLPLEHRTDADFGLVLIGEPFSKELGSFGGSGANTWSRVSGVNDAWLGLDPATGLLSGTPASGDAGPGEITVQVADTVSPFTSDTRSFTFEVVNGVWFDSLDTNPVGWTLSCQWEWGTPTNVGPSSCYSGSCLGLNLDGYYDDNLSWLSCTATSPPIDLTGTVSPVLRFASYLESEGGAYDGGNLKVSVDGMSFTRLDTVDPPYNLPNVNGQPAWGGYPGFDAWLPFEADLSSYADMTVWLRFAFRSDYSAALSGWYIDELMITD